MVCFAVGHHVLLTISSKDDGGRIRGNYKMNARSRWNIRGYFKTKGVHIYHITGLSIHCEFGEVVYMDK
jgi:hypothetical protein